MTTPSVDDRIRAEEGWNPHAYQDNRPEKFWTIGYGFLVDPRRGDGMPKQVGEFWLQYELRQRVAALTDRWAPYATQPQDVREALQEMAYQLGVDGVLGFKLMLAALARGDRQAAAQEMLDSGWHEQTKDRCERVAARVRGS